MNQTSIEFSSNHPDETLKKRCRTVSANYRERSSKIHKEIAQANEARLLKEVERPKILIEETTLYKPKPPTFYISKAKENYQKKNSFKGSVSIDRKKLFGQLLSTQIFRKSEKLRILNSDTKTHEKIVSKSFQTEILPSWLLERPDYQAAVKKIQSADANISNICEIPPFNRTEDEKGALFKWVSSTSFFSKVPARIIKDTCDKLIRMVFNKGDILIKKGEEGDCIYIIFSGKAELYLEPDVVHIVIGSKSVIGEHSLDTLKPRTATIIAAEELVTFKLTKLDYDTILLNTKKLEKHKNAKLLMSISFFRNWSYLKVQHLSNHFIQKIFEPGDIIFDKGEDSDTFFIISSGTVEIQAYVQLQHINRWPTGGKQWKILEINRKYIVPITVLKKGHYFGENTLIEQLPRVCRAVCKTKAVCLTINKDDFFDIFSVKDLETLQNHCYTIMPKDSELEKQLVNEMKTKASTVRIIQEQAIFNSMEVDFMNPEGRESLLDGKTKKLRGWIFNIKKRMKDNTLQFKKRVVTQEKKNIELGSIVMLNSYFSDLKKK